jgi:hypothetical protein
MSNSKYRLSLELDNPQKMIGDEDDFDRKRRIAQIISVPK